MLEDGQTVPIIVGIGEHPPADRDYVVNFAIVGDVLTGGTSMAFEILFEGGAELRFLLDPGEIQTHWVLDVGDAGRLGFQRDDDVVYVWVDDLWKRVAAKFARDWQQRHGRDK